MASSWREIWDAGPHFERVSELLESARRSVVIVGWQLDSRLRLSKNETECLREKVLRLCERNPELQFYLLLWDHPIFYIPQREWLQTRVWEELHPRVHLVFDNHHPFGASHHEKIIIVDGQTALVGSTDLCDERWDSPRHLPFDRVRSLDHQSDSYGPYHELGLELSGPVCLELLKHIESRWRLLSTIPLLVEADRNQLSLLAPTQIHLSRTHSELDEPLTREVEFLFEFLIRSAKSRIWLEGQYFWSERVAHALLAKMKSHVQSSHPSSDNEPGPLRITITLADNSLLRGLSRMMIPHQTRLLAELQAFARHHPNQIWLEVFRPYSGARPIYVHSKIVLIDDCWLSIGSANFAERALRLDSEIMVTIDARESVDRDRLKGFLLRLERHWAFPIQRRRVDAQLELELLQSSRIQRWLSAIAWRSAIDPSLPFFYRTKRRIRSWLKRPGRRHLAQNIWLATATTAGLVPAAYYIWTHTPLAATPTELTLCLLLCGLMNSVWILPVPWAALAILTAFLFPDWAAQIIVLSWWSAVLMSTLWGRFFPGMQLDWIKRHGRQLLPEFGSRRFGDALLGWTRPWDSAHIKLLSQSHYFMPGPWILLIHGALVASLAAWAVAGIHELHWLIESLKP